MDKNQPYRESLDELLSSDITGESSAEASYKPRSPKVTFHNNTSLTPGFDCRRLPTPCFDYNKTLNQNLDIKRSLTPSFDNNKYLTPRFDRQRPPTLHFDKQRSPTLYFDKQRSPTLRFDKRNSPSFGGGTLRSPKWSLDKHESARSSCLSSSTSIDLQPSCHLLRNTSTLLSNPLIDDLRPVISNRMSETAFGPTSLPPFVQEKTNQRPSSTQPSICGHRSISGTATRDLDDMTNLSETPDYKANNFYSYKRSLCRPVDEILRKYGITCSENTTPQAVNDSFDDSGLFKRLVKNHTPSFNEEESHRQNSQAEPSELSLQQTKLKEYRASHSPQTVNASRDKDRLSTKSSGLTVTSPSLTVQSHGSPMQSPGLTAKLGFDRRVRKPSPHSSHGSSPSLSVVDETKGGQDEDVSSLTTETGQELPSQEKCCQYISTLPEQTPETFKGGMLRVDIHAPASACQVTFSDAAKSEICIRGTPLQAPRFDALSAARFDSFANAVQLRINRSNQMMENAGMPSEASGGEETSSQLALQELEKSDLASGVSQTSLPGSIQQLQEMQAKASWNSVPVNPYSLPPFMDAVDFDFYIRSQHLLRLQRVVELGQMTNFLASLSSSATGCSPDSSVDSIFKNFYSDNILAPSTRRWSSERLPLASPQGCAQAARLNENQVFPIGIDNCQQYNNSNTDHLDNAKQKEKGNKKVANKNVVIYYTDGETKVGPRGGKKKWKRQILRRTQELNKPGSVPDKIPQDSSKDKDKDKPKQKAREMRSMLTVIALLVVMVIMIVLLLPGLKAALS